MCGTDVMTSFTELVLHVSTVKLTDNKRTNGFGPIPAVVSSKA